MSEAFHLGAFLARWHGLTRHDLTASHSQTLPLSELLALATPAEQQIWAALSLDYAAPQGAAGLRDLIADRYQHLLSDQIICCAGAQEAMACVARALLAPGDHAVVVLPIYQPLGWAITDRVEATGVSLDPDEFSLDPDRVAAALRPNTRLLLTNFPNSPTGAVLSPAAQRQLVALCRARGLWWVNDEVYGRTVSDGITQAPPVADAYERGISVDALSKGSGLPGLRVGWVACRDPALLDSIATAKAALSSCLAAPSELLAGIALRQDAILVARARRVGAANRHALDQLLARRSDLFEADPSRNLAFAFPRYRGAQGADEFARWLVAACGTLILPSDIWRSALGTVPENHLRISLGQSGVAAGLAAMETALLRASAA